MQSSMQVDMGERDTPEKEQLRHEVNILKSQMDQVEEVASLKAQLYCQRQETLIKQAADRHLSDLIQATRQEAATCIQYGQHIASQKFKQRSLQNDQRLKDEESKIMRAESSAKRNFELEERQALSTARMFLENESELTLAFAQNEHEEAYNALYAEAKDCIQEEAVKMQGLISKLETSEALRHEQAAQADAMSTRYTSPVSYTHLRAHET